jgi:hypothetical protein
VLLMQGWLLWRASVLLLLEPCVHGSVAPYGEAV